MRLLILASVALALLQAPSAAAGCVPGGAVCVDAASSTALSCTLDGAAFTCDIRADRLVTASMAAPGEAEVRAWIEVGVCTGGSCMITQHDASSACAWGVGGQGCAVSGSFTDTRSGTISDCLTVWVYQPVTGHVRAAGVPADLRQDPDVDEDWFDSC